MMEMEIDTQEEPSNELIGHFDHIFVGEDLVSGIKQEPKEENQENPLNPLYVQHQDCVYCGKEIKERSRLGKTLVRSTSLEISKKNILHQCAQRRDAFGDAVRLRLLNIGKMIEGEIHYHTKCKGAFFSRKKIQEITIKTEKLPELPPLIAIEPIEECPRENLKKKTFLRLCEYLDTKPHTYEFILTDLVDKMKKIGGENAALAKRYLKRKLMEYYGKKLIYKSKQGCPNIFTFTADKVVKKKVRNKAHEAHIERQKQRLQEARKAQIERRQQQMLKVQMAKLEKKKQMQKQIRIKVIKAAARILQEDINETDNNKNDTSVDKELLVPSSLEIFLNELIPISKNAAISQESIAQTIMSACKP